VTSQIVANPHAGLSLTLGEGPGWNDQTGQFSCVDIFGKTIYVFGIDGQEINLLRTFRTPTEVGAALPLDDGSFISCERGGIFRIAPDNRRTQIAPLPVSDPAFRCNDAKIGPDGRVWVGVMHEDAVDGAGSLWAIDSSGDSTCLLEGLTIPNGMDWWDDCFWFVDGPTPEIRKYRVSDGKLTDTGEKVATPTTPDGFTMDSDGNMWLAIWGGGQVVCLSQEGDTLHTVSVASPHTTSTCLIDDTLVITSATLALDEDVLAAHPFAGAIFTAQVPARGRKTFTDFLSASPR
jgi:sugar lactone lactonase YvrE